MCSVVYYHNVEMWNSPRFLASLPLYFLFCALTKTLKLVHLLERDVTTSHVRFNLTLVVLVTYTCLLSVEIYVFTKLVSTALHEYT